MKKLPQSASLLALMFFCSAWGGAMAQDVALSPLSDAQLAKLQTAIQQAPAADIESYQVALYAPFPIFTPDLGVDEVVEKFTVKNSSTFPVIVVVSSYHFPDGEAKKLGELKIAAGGIKSIAIPKIVRSDVIFEFYFPENPDTEEGWRLKERATLDRTLLNLILQKR